METNEEAACGPQDHASVPVTATDRKALARASEIFRAAGDLPRLSLLDLLRGGELCVAEMASATGTKLSTLSQQLRILRTEDLIVSRRQGKHIFYSLADQHIAALLENVLAHAGGDCSGSSPQPDHDNTHDDNTHDDNTHDDNTEEYMTMSEHVIHEGHTHQHSPNCGHVAVQHNGHLDYLHDGHLHHPHDGHVDEHILEISAVNPDACTPDHRCDAHEAGHRHGPDCGHAAIPHGDHVDYLVAGHLHHPHDGHCDNHGPVVLVV